MTRFALISTSNKTGLIDFVRTLIEQFQFTIVSSGGTAQTLQAAGLAVTKVSEYTGAPEILGGRVKTLHPKIHGGILARLGEALDQQDLVQQGINPIALVVVNLYPFQETIAKEHVTEAAAIEQIDIGGPALLRAAAKNHHYVTALCHPDQYSHCLIEMAAHHGETSLAFRRQAAAQAFQLTQAYDQAIATYLCGEAKFTITGNQPRSLRYGENPHQPATWYQSERWGWSIADQCQGKELSYNNLLDLEAARSLIGEFIDDRPAAVIVKHNNPCGVALGSTLVQAYQKALAADPISAFGGIVALNRFLDIQSAQEIVGTFLECVVATGAEPAALEILQTKPNVRVLLLPNLTGGPAQTIRMIAGGFLVQQSDDLPVQPSSWSVVTDRQPTPAQMAEMIFAWKVCRHVKSNAIVITNGARTVGIGAGQMNRIGSAQIALHQADRDAQGAVLASDGFFPFDDTVRTAAAAGVEAIVQPGGSIRDQDSIKAANELGVVMLMTHMRHFLH